MLKSLLYKEFILKRMRIDPSDYDKIEDLFFETFYKRAVLVGEGFLKTGERVKVYRLLRMLCDKISYKLDKFPYCIGIDKEYYEKARKAVVKNKLVYNGTQQALDKYKLIKKNKILRKKDEIFVPIEWFSDLFLNKIILD